MIGSGHMVMRKFLSSSLKSTDFKPTQHRAQSTERTCLHQSVPACHSDTRTPGHQDTMLTLSADR